MTISLTLPSGSVAKAVLGRDGNVYAVVSGTVSVPIAVAPPLITAGYIAGAVS